MELDEDLWAEILKRLPVDVLLRFRSVCKSWNSLISSPAFIRAQYLFSSSDFIESKPYILFDFYSESEIDCPTWYASCYDPDPFNPSESQHRLGFQAGSPFDCDLDVLSDVMDVIHGVVCLSVVYHGLHFDEPDSGQTILWNLAIRKVVRIPCRNFMFDVGFGFDGRTNDFKVVRTDMQWVTPGTFEVYSYREGRSRTVDSDHIGPFNLICYYLGFYQSCFKNGAIHWIVWRQNFERLAILRFDCESEELTAMDLPQRFSQADLDFDIGRLFVRFREVLLLGNAEAGFWAIDQYDVDTSRRKAAYHNDITMITRDGECSVCRNASEEEGIKRSQPPWNGYVFEPSLLLMDAESVAPRDGEISYTSFRLIND